MIPRAVFIKTISFCVNVRTKESIYPSIFVAAGSRQAVLNQGHNLRILPMPSIPAVA